MHHKKLLWFGLMALCAGSILAVSQFRDLKHGYLERTWPDTEGEILSSQITGKRAYHPEIRYAYTVNDTVYQGKTDMGTPGFGTRNQRFQTARNITREFKQGDKIKVYYNPEHPSESLLHRGIPWQTLIKFGIGCLLSAFGLFLAVWMTAKR